MSDTTVSSETPADSSSQATPPEGAGEQQVETFDAEYVSKLRKEAARYRNEAKTNSEAAEKLAQLEDSRKSDEQKAADRATAAEKRAEDAEARATRREIALEYQLTKDDADLLDSLSQEEAMRRFAERLAAKNKDVRRSSNHVPSEGHNPTPGDDPMREFARNLFAAE